MAVFWQLLKMSFKTTHQKIQKCHIFGFFVSKKVYNVQGQIEKNRVGFTLPQFYIFEFFGCNLEAQFLKLSKLSQNKCQLFFFCGWENHTSAKNRYFVVLFCDIRSKCASKLLGLSVFLCPKNALLDLFKKFFSLREWLLWNTGANTFFIQGFEKTRFLHFFAFLEKILSVIIPAFWKKIEKKPKIETINVDFCVWQKPIFFVNVFSKFYLPG